MPSPSQIRGAEQEALAERLLTVRGYEVVERNWRGGGGEVDRIAWHEGLLCFVEIRSRVGEAGGTPEESVDVRKRHRLIRAARAFLTRFPPDAPPMVRFDVVGIVSSSNRTEPEITLLANAFDASGRPS